MLQDEVSKYSLRMTKINIANASKPKVYNIKSSINPDLVGVANSFGVIPINNTPKSPIRPRITLDELNSNNNNSININKEVTNVFCHSGAYIQELNTYYTFGGYNGITRHNDFKYYYNFNGDQTKKYKINFDNFYGENLYKIKRT
jgi:hypothetical protein